MGIKITKTFNLNRTAELQAYNEYKRKGARTLWAGNNHVCLIIKE